MIQPSVYSDRFYENVAASAEGSAREVVPVVLDLLRPRSVVDVGCGAGTWLAEFRRRGVTDLLGLDGPWIRPSALEIPRALFAEADLTSPLRATRQFDLVVSLEVAEHLPPESADGFVHSLTTFGPVVLFSAAIPHQGGTHHVNEQWPAYWAALFARQGYVAVDCLRSRFWNNGEVASWYVQNMMLMVEKTYLLKHENLFVDGQDARVDSVPALVHPRQFLKLVEELRTARRQADLRERWCSEVLSAVPHVLTRAIRTRIARLASQLHGLVATQEI